MCDPACSEPCGDREELGLIGDAQHHGDGPRRGRTALACGMRDVSSEDALGQVLADDHEVGLRSTARRGTRSGNSLESENAFALTVDVASWPSWYDARVLLSRPLESEAVGLAAVRVTCPAAAYIAPVAQLSPRKLALRDTDWSVRPPEGVAYGAVIGEREEPTKVWTHPGSSREPPLFGGSFSFVLLFPVAPCLTDAEQPALGPQLDERWAAPCALDRHRPSLSFPGAKLKTCPQWALLKRSMYENS